MSSRHGRVTRVLTALLALAGATALIAQDTRPRFKPDDPRRVDLDTRHDARQVKEIEFSETFDFLRNTFTEPGDRRAIRAVNVNTLGEVPDSSWFTNRIGVRDMDAAELRRGPNRFDTAEALTWDTWTVTQGKGPGGFHPGFRGERPGDPGQVYQLEIDPVGHPRLATGAEMVGTLIYHALGYHVQDVYPVRVHPSKIRVAPSATVRDAAGRRQFTQHDLDGILRVAARDRDGRVYLSATRYEEGDDLGNFAYYGVRTDDPNDLYPHEHRRELRANRVFGAWLAHDDSRAVNTRNIRKRDGERRYIEHFMHDFGALLGSATRFPDAPISNHQYYVEGRSSLMALLTLGLRTPRPLRVPVPADIAPGIGGFESETFDPPRWKANYPNAAFANLQPEDAFWGARLVSRFSDEALRAIVDAADYDAAAATYLAGALARRRDKVARAWLTPLNPVTGPTLAADGTLTFANAAVDAGVASHGAYEIAWARFDNATGARTEVATDRVTAARATAPAVLLADAAFIAVTIRTIHADFPAWARPVHAWFRRDGGRWTTVGLERDGGVGR